MPAASWDAWYAGTLITSRVDAAAPSLSTSPRRGEGKRAVFFLKDVAGPPLTFAVIDEVGVVLVRVVVSVLVVVLGGGWLAAAVGAAV